MDRYLRLSKTPLLLAFWTRVLENAQNSEGYARFF